LIISLFFVVTVFSQEGDNSLPKSWELNLSETVALVQLSPLDLEYVIAQDSINDLDKSTPWRFGIERPLTLNIQQNGRWSHLPEGGKIWRTAIRSPEALNMSINFSDFYIPPGSRVQLYDNDHKIISQTLHGSTNREKIGRASCRERV